MLSLGSRKASKLLFQGARSVGHRVPDEALRNKGITNPNVIRNPSVTELYEYAMRPELKYNTNPAVRPTTISSTGALINYSGKRTGRVPKEKRVVKD